MQIQNLFLTQIAEDAFLRDRTAPDPALQDELMRSILADGLRQPIEVVELYEPIGSHTHALVSGMRRLTAMRAIACAKGTADSAQIPVILREPQSMIDILRDIAGENEQRAAISMFEKGRFLNAAVDHGHVATLDAAIAQLFPGLPRSKSYRLRAAAEVAQTLDGSLTTPEALSQAQIEALALALRRGMADLIDEVLKLHRLQPLALQMQALKPVLTESAQLTDADAEITRRTGTPRRLMRLPQGLTIRREQTAKGWLLHFSGPEARPGALMDDVFRLIEMTFTPNH